MPAVNRIRVLPGLACLAFAAGPLPSARPCDPLELPAGESPPPIDLVVDDAARAWLDGDGPGFLREKNDRWQRK